MHVSVDYPDISAEAKILQLVRNEAANTQTAAAPKEIDQKTLINARQSALNIFMSPAVEEYIVQLVMATRQPELYDEELRSWIEFGSSPRGTIALDRCARVNAWLNNNDFVSPDDVQAVLHDVLRHRLILSFEAEASGINPDQVIDRLLSVVPAS